MLSTEQKIDYTVAQGAEGLSHVLKEWLVKSKADPAFAQEERFILYQMGDQKSLIKVNMQTVPFQFWHYDLMGRPSNRLIKKTLAKFVWDECGGKELYLQEFEKGEFKE